MAKHLAVPISNVIFLDLTEPDTLIFLTPGRPYRGKPSDMWALGVVLFTMLYGQFPFYDSIPQELFRKIKAAEYSIPEWVFVFMDFCEILASLAQLIDDTHLLLFIFSEMAV